MVCEFGDCEAVPVEVAPAGEEPDVRGGVVPAELAGVEGAAGEVVAGAEVCGADDVVGAEDVGLDECVADAEPVCDGADVDFEREACGADEPTGAGTLRWFEGLSEWSERVCFAAADVDLSWVGGGAAGDCESLPVSRKIAIVAAMTSTLAAAVITSALGRCRCLVGGTGPEGEAAAGCGAAATMPVGASANPAATGTASGTSGRDREPSLRSARATSDAEGRTAGSNSVIAYSSPGQGSGRSAGIAGRCVSRAAAASSGVPVNARCPVSASSSTNPSE